MTNRPLSVTIIGCLFLAAGAIGFAYHATEFNARQPFGNDALWVLLVHAIAVVCGVYMLRGSNWARWGALVWMAYHVILSSFHSLSQLATHAVLLAVIAWLLLRPSASRYFAAAHQTPPNSFA